MMKTPDEIKKELERCTTYICGLPYCEGCLYGIDAEKAESDCVDALLKDALAYIHQLEARIDTLTAKAVLFDEAVAAGEKMKRERDAAVEDLETMGEARAYCDTCLHNNTNLKEDPCSSCMSGYLINNWQWRGVEVE